MVYKAKSFPPQEVRAIPWPFLNIEEAEQGQADKLTEYEDHHPQFVIVEFDDLYYVVYGNEMYKGFKDYE